MSTRGFGSRVFALQEFGDFIVVQKVIVQLLAVSRGCTDLIFGRPRVALLTRRVIRYLPGPAQTMRYSTILNLVPLCYDRR